MRYWIRVSSPHVSKGSTLREVNVIVPTRDYIEFQERSVAKGYLISFRCYGTWLHGDERGSVDRRWYNKYGAPMIKSDAEKVSRKASQLKNEAFLLGGRERKVVENAIKEVCDLRGYGLFAVNVRTNHVHVVVSNSDRAERLMNSFKAYSTRARRNAALLGAEDRAWSRHGSTGYLWTDDHMSAAVDYVVNGQGGELPKFD